MFQRDRLRRRQNSPLRNHRLGRLRRRLARLVPHQANLQHRNQVCFRRLLPVKRRHCGRLSPPVEPPVFCPVLVRLRHLVYCPVLDRLLLRVQFRVGFQRLLRVKHRVCNRPSCPVETQVLCPVLVRPCRLVPLQVVAHLRRLVLRQAPVHHLLRVKLRVSFQVCARP